MKPVHLRAAMSQVSRPRSSTTAILQAFVDRLHLQVQPQQRHRSCPRKLMLVGIRVRWVVAKPLHDALGRRYVASASIPHTVTTKVT